MIKMKNLWSLQTIIMVAMLSMGFASCGDDDDDETTTVIDDNGNNSGGGSSNSTEPNTSGTLDGHDYVDLGLSVKWATCNIGANSPEGAGFYFAWGDANERTTFTYDNYAYYDSHYSNGDWHLYKNIGKDISGTKYDIARNKWSSSWRMPTMKEFDELVDKCTSKWMSYKGVYGRLFTGPNGKSLFLPAVGGYKDNGLEYYGSWGEYWSSYCGTYLDEKEDGRAYFFEFSSDDTSMLGWASISRSQGKSVRPVTALNNSGGSSGGGGSSTESLYFTNFNFTATQTSVTVKFYTNEKPTSASIKYGENTPSTSASATITSHEISATIRGLKKGTKYYVKCTASNSSGSVTSDNYPVMTNY